MTTDEENQKDIKQNLAIENLMKETYNKAKELNCNISVNTKTGRMSWEKNFKK
jgi:hypothetical protein